MQSAYTLNKEKIKCKPEIMIPLVGSVNEFINQKTIIDNVAMALKKKYKTIISYSVGTMIELPRACVIADKIADTRKPLYKAIIIFSLLPNLTK